MTSVLTTAEQQAAEEPAVDWENIRKDDSAPFVCRVETSCGKYVYDVNTSEILRVDGVVWDIIDDFGPLDECGLVAKYRQRHRPEDIRAACTRIRNAQERDGLLRPKHPHVVFEVTPENEHVITDAVAGDRTQVTLNVTEACNFRCAYCPYTLDTEIDRRCHSDRMMNWEVARLALDDFLRHARPDTEENMRIAAISFYGGEPLLNFPLIKKSVEHVLQHTDKKLVFQITTNGSLLRDEVAEFLASHRFFISVSLDGPEHVHNANRRTIRGEGTWSLVTRNLKTFKDRYLARLTRNDGALSISATLPPGADALEFDRYLTEDPLCADLQVRASRMRPPSRGLFRGLPPERCQADNLDVLYRSFLDDLAAGKVTTEAHRYAVQRSLFEERYLDIHKRSCVCSEHRCFPDTYPFPLSTCIPGTRRCFVSVDGDYYACERVPDNKDQRLGNVYDGIDVQKVLAMYKAFFELNHEQCGYCWLLGICQVGCFANVDLTEADKRRACSQHREGMHSRLVNYCTIMEKNPHAFDYTEKIQRV
jgi:uncharacterized protein